MADHWFGAGKLEAGWEGKRGNGFKNCPSRLLEITIDSMAEHGPLTRRFELYQNFSSAAILYCRCIFHALTVAR